jgi:uncharacterized membrane protein YeaQ/YmgE (transglycosylase-associated protein family)
MTGEVYPWRHGRITVVQPRPVSAVVEPDSGCVPHNPPWREDMWIIWAIIIGGVAGFIARLISPSPNNPQGFILTVVLGIIGGVVATWLGRAVGWYSPGEGAGFIASIVGAVIILFIWHLVARNRAGTGYPPS